MIKKMTILVMGVLCFLTEVAFCDEVDNLIKNLRNPSTRKEVINSLEKRKDIIPILQRVLKDKKELQDKRISAIILLGKTKEQTCSQFLVEILEDKGEDHWVREASVIALGELGEKMIIKKLQAALDDESGNVRMRAVWALARMGDKSGEELALHTIKNGNPTEKLLATEALKEIGDEDVIPRLQKYFDEPVAWTRIFAKLAIAKIKAKKLSGDSLLSYYEKTLSDEQFEISQWAGEKLADIVLESDEFSKEKSLAILKKIAKDKENHGSYVCNKVLRRLVELGKVLPKEIEK